MQHIKKKFKKKKCFRVHIRSYNPIDDASYHRYSQSPSSSTTLFTANTDLLFDVSQRITGVRSTLIWCQ